MDIKLACNHVYYLSHRYLEESDEKRCEACGVKIRDISFTCLRCNVWLHCSCAEELLHDLPHEIIHPFHSQHQLKLQFMSWDFICDKCLYISAGYSYGCSSCDFYLDLSCASSFNDQLPKDQESLRFKDGKKKTIHHYIYNDMLTVFKYRKINEEDYDCVWCEKRLSGVCYGCIRREFFLHEGCRDKIPRKLYHPSHPGHPLRLHCINRRNYYCNACEEDIFDRTYNSPSYNCQICNFRLDFHCAKRLPTLKHECHHHLLTLIFRIPRKGYGEQDLYCKACDKLCDANVYRCVQCDFSFHPLCVIPSSVKHRYHRHPLVFTESIKEDDSGEYYCDVCENERNPMHPVYCCESCTYIAHIECVVNEDKISSEKGSSSALQSMDSKALLENEMEHNEGTDDINTLIQPLIHPHPLRFYEVTEKLKTKYCDGCRLVLGGPSYVCTICPDDIRFPLPKGEYYYLLHEKCAKLPYEIQHPFHSSHPLNLYTIYRPDIGLYIICDECRDICLGFIYLCEECNFKLDVKCATLTAHEIGVSGLKEMDRVTELHHFNHHHKLVLGYCNDPIRNPECTICELPILGAAYFCPGPYCNYILHESCLGLPQKIQVPFHLEHMLVISHPTSSDSQCYACPLSLSLSYYRYNCEHCHLSLHSICANSLRRPLKCESHLHNLYYFGSNYQLLRAKYGNPSLFGCTKCQKSCEGGSFYRCLQCAINFHLKCVPIPDIVKSRYHIHPLSLKDSFVEDDSGKYYCDICEDERNPDDQVYYCEECNGVFVAHIECVLAKAEEAKRLTYSSS